MELAVGPMLSIVIDGGLHPEIPGLILSANALKAECSLGARMRSVTIDFLGTQMVTAAPPSVLEDIGLFFSTSDGPSEPADPDLTIQDHSRGGGRLQCPR